MQWAPPLLSQQQAHAVGLKARRDAVAIKAAIKDLTDRDTLVEVGKPGVLREMAQSSGMSDEGSD